MTDPPAHGRDDDEHIDVRFAEIVAGLSWDAPEDEVFAKAARDAPDPPESRRPRAPGEARESGDTEMPGEAGKAGDTVGMPPVPSIPDSGGSTFVTLPPLLGLPDGRGAWRGYEPLEEDEHFLPPDPELPPVHDATYWAAVAGLVLGPLLVLWAAFLSGNPDPGWWIVTGIALTVVGFGLLVLRGSTDADTEDDDGAKV
ncbi:MAG TPA: hypothetical protein PLL54_02985 [Dermatophilaceae bacterium]|nr:hypothetical protein [Dermatophilaceae bacterium]